MKKNNNLNDIPNNDNQYSKYYNVQDNIIIEEKDLNKNHFLWKHKNIFAIILTWITTILLLFSTILGVSYAKNHSLISFGYDFSQTSEIQMQNWVGNVNDEKTYVDDPVNHLIASGQEFLDAAHSIHDKIDTFFRNNQILYYDNINTINKTFFNPNAYVNSTYINPAIDPQAEQIYTYIISFNTGINNKETEMSKIFDTPSIQKGLYTIMDGYNEFITPLIKKNPNVSKYAPVDSHETWKDDWAKSSTGSDFRLFYFQHGVTSQNIIQELIAIFLTFIILTLILVAYFLIKYGIGSSLAIILAFISYGILSISALICSSLVISGTSVIMIFSGFILMVINLSILMPIYMKIRKEELMHNSKLKKELSAEDIYNITRKAIKSYSRIFLLEFLVIIIPTIIFLLCNIIINLQNHVPIWIIFRYNISNELLLIMCMLFALIICFIIFLPLWAKLQTTSIKFWKLFHYRATTLKDDPEESTFENLNNVQNDEEMLDAFQNK